MSPSAAEAFESQRSRLFAVAYRMLGSASEAEDVVQDAWLRYSAASRDEVRSHEAFLTTIVTRLCLDRLKSARATREHYVGTWLPEPMLASATPEAGPEHSAVLNESVTLAFMLLLETLSPEERATFLLREIFEYDYEEIAAMLDTTPANCRQLFHRARVRVQERRPRVHFADEEARQKRELVERFVAAFRDGDADQLTSLLTEDVGLWSDGGGKVAAARRPVVGRADVINLLVGIRRSARSYGIELSAVTLDVVDVNAEPAVAVRIEGRLDSIYTCSFDGGRITALRIVRNPDKLQFIGRQLDHQTH
jgi:RNA polymerase sigma-70 factor (TIGR02957 family)